jgi:hypothetical protein
VDFDSDEPAVAAGVVVAELSDFVLPASEELSDFAPDPFSAGAVADPLA